MSLDSTQYSNYIISALARCRLSAIVYQTKKKEVLNLDLQNKAKARDKPIFWAFNGLAKPDHAKKTHVWFELKILSPGHKGINQRPTSHYHNNYVDVNQ